MGGSKSTSVSGSAQKWAQPFAQSAAGNVQSVYNQQQPQLQQITQGVTNTLPGLSSMFEGWNPTTQQSQGYYGDVLSGKYLDPSNNTALQSILNQTNRDVTGNVNSQFAGAGRYGSAAHTDVLSRNLAEAEGGILSNQYNLERGFMDQAASAAPQQQAQSLAQLLQASGVGAELPYTGTNALANQLSALFSGGTQKQGGGTLGQIIGAVGQVGAGAAQAGAFSDRRLKSNIIKIDEMEDGLGIYEYDIFGERQRGVMADEVERLRPHALGPVVDGYATVDYGRL